MRSVGKLKGTDINSLTLIKMGLLLSWPKFIFFYVPIFCIILMMPFVFRDFLLNAPEIDELTVYFFRCLQFIFIVGFFVAAFIQLKVFEETGSEYYKAYPSELAKEIQGN